MRQNEVMLKLGDRFDRYCIESVLGQGGMGIVYGAHDPKLDRPIALKVVTLDTDDAKARLLREARSTAALDHPNAVAIYDVGEFDGSPFIAMEMVQGKTLRTLLAEGSPSPRQRLRWLLDAARALAAAHRAGIVHRDVKPENVMVRDDDVVKVLDFGIARRVDAPIDPTSTTQGAGGGGSTGAPGSWAASIITLTKTGQAVGTPLYMTPEQIRGDALDGRCDQFAWGVLAYEMLTGHVPWVRRDALGLVASILQDEPEPPKIEGLPPEVGDVILHALRKAPADRYATMEEIIDLLEPIAAEPAEGSRYPSSTNEAKLGGGPDASAPPASSTRRRAWWITIGVAAAIAATAAAVFVPPALSSPLARPDSVLACPPLAATGADEPSGWLGAAAASLVCRRAAMMLGGRRARTLVPAELMNLPHEPSTSTPVDVYADAGLRARLLAEASRRADVVVDGTVELRGDTFLVTLVLQRSNGREIARASASAPLLHRATAAALDRLAAGGAVPLSTTLDEDTRAFLGTNDATTASLLADLGVSMELDFRVPEIDECDKVEARRSTLTDAAFQTVHARCEHARRGTPAGVGRVPVDRSSPPAFALTALASGSLDVQADPSALADEAHALLDQTTDPASRARVTVAESELAFRAGDADRARGLALRAVHEDPREAEAWYAATSFSLRQPGVEIAARAMEAWTPEQSDGWNIDAFSEPGVDPKMRLRLGRRAMVLSPHNPVYASNLVDYLLADGQHEEARNLAARMQAGTPHERATAESILISIDAGEARFGAALARAREVLATTKEIGILDQGDYNVLELGLVIGLLLGRGAELADIFAQRFVLGEPTRLFAWSDYTLREAAFGCALATRPIAVACFDRLRALLRSGYFHGGHTPNTLPFLDGAERYARGDTPGAVAAWRPLVRATRHGWLLGLAFDEGGEPDLADRVETSRPGSFNGATIFDLAAARRAKKRGDDERAKALAKRIIDAWSVADVPVAAVAEMRAIVSPPASPPPQTRSSPQRWPPGLPAFGPNWPLPPVPPTPPVPLQEE